MSFALQMTHGSSKQLSGLDLVYSWSDKNNMIFNDSKCRHVCFSSKKDQTSNAYKSASKNAIENSETAKDLSIVVSSNFSFENHIRALVRQCKQFSNWTMITQDPI